MTADTLRAIEIDRIAKGRYRATNRHGITLEFGTVGEEAFTPIELLLTAIAGCTAADVDYITVKRAEPTSFRVRVKGDKVRDRDGNRMENIEVTFEVRFPEGEGGDDALAILPEAVARSHDRLCTVSRTVELGTPVRVELSG